MLEGARRAPVPGPGGPDGFRRPRLRRLAATLVWLAALLAAAGLWRLAAMISGAPPMPRPPSLPDVSVRPLTPQVRTDAGDAQPWLRTSGAGWQVVHQLSAHHVLVLEVETERVGEAAAIAHQLADPVRSRYSEILVYVFRPGRRGGLPAARVQWTPRGGYVATWYESRPRERP